ncbi:MAG: hypothetical protein HQ525_11975 [Anaerolineae bacterium]|nr:hypothetical protein [Anaerolineae bacterium]
MSINLVVTASIFSRSSLPPCGGDRHVGQPAPLQVREALLAMTVSILV